jgi:molybdate transport system ATP-binding protein
VITVRDVTIVKSGKTLFQDFNWQINPEENWIIRGKNGSGKTSLLELLAGILSPTEGEVNYSFITANSWEERYHKRKEYIHYLSSDAALSQVNPHELFYQQRYYSLGDEWIPAVKELLGEEVVRKINRFNFPASLSINHLLDLKVTRLSNGQSKKVMILKNLAQQIPKMLILDYPLEGLDRQSRKELRDFLDFLSRKHSVQLIITDHDEELPSAINHELVLDNFKIVSTSSRKAPQKTFAITKREVTPFTKGIPIVEMKNVSIRYGEATIIKNLNWVIHCGERWAITGKNGSGKTTLFSLIFADHPLAYSESVYLFGQRRGSGESIWDIKNRVSYLGPEQMTFLNTKNVLLSGEEFILSQNKNVTAEKLNELTDYFTIHHFINRPLRSLSSGQLQIILIVNCLSSQKELILLDEPFRFLDPQQKERVNTYLLSHLNESVTSVIITHDERDITFWGAKVLQL